MAMGTRQSDQSSLWVATSESRTRRAIDLETHRAVFTWVQERLVEAGLLKDKTVAIDAITIEATAATLGASLALLGAAVHFGTAAVAGLAVVIGAFLLLTAPVAAHAIGRAGYRRKSPLWQGTIADELADGHRSREEGA